MEQRFVDEKVYTEHSKMCDERFARDKQDISDMKSDVDDIKKLTVEIAALVKKNDDALEKHDKRISNLEHKPSVWIDRIISAGISTLVATVVTAVISGGVLG